jgi:hypothetical protein
MFFYLFPNLPRGWFKGADTTTLTHFLEDWYTKILADHPNHEHVDYIQAILSGLKASNKFFQTLYRANLWLSTADRDILVQSLAEVLSSFKACAKYSFRVLNITRWKFQPKFHMLSEVRYHLLLDKENNIRSISPLSFCCQMDEDFVGRLSQMSRMVSSRRVHTKTLERYKLAVCSVW